MWKYAEGPRSGWGGRVGGGELQVEVEQVRQAVDRWMLGMVPGWELCGPLLLGQGSGGRHWVAGVPTGQGRAGPVEG